MHSCNRIQKFIFKIASEREIQSKETQILALQSEIEILKKSCSTVDSDEIKRELTRRDMTVLNLQRQLAVAEKNQLAKYYSLRRNNSNPILSLNIVSDAHLFNPRSKVCKTRYLH